MDHIGFAGRVKARFRYSEDKREIHMEFSKELAVDMLLAIDAYVNTRYKLTPAMTELVDVLHKMGLSVE